MSVEIDPNILLSSILGGLITMIGSLAVAAFYIRNQRRSEKKRLLHERIQKTYFDEGILRMEAAISEYGINTVFAIHDINTWIGRSLKLRSDKKLLKQKFLEISKRSIIVDLTKRNFGLATRWVPAIQRFGMPLYFSVMKTIALYSDLLMELLDLDAILNQVATGSTDEFVRSLSNFVKMVDIIKLYVERRLEYLKEYVWQRDYEDYLNFLEITKEKKYQAFLSELEKYLKYLEDWAMALRSEKPEDRINTSLALSKWLTEHVNLNPFESTDAEA